MKKGLTSMSLKFGGKAIVSYLGLLAGFGFGIVSASAGQHGMGGCGLGSVVFQGSNGMEQILASTTNGTFYSSTFGITSGTSNCTPDNPRVAAETFITINRVALEKDAARGEGEAIATLASVLKCEDSKVFGDTLNSNFSQIFGSSELRASEVLKNMESAVKNNSAGKCEIFS